MKRTYHIGFRTDRPGPLAGDGHKRLVVQVADSVDNLSCELWRYMGPRVTTIANLERRKADLLQAVNLEMGTSFNRIRIERC